MGSRPNENFAYIAGFLDGDGSLMLQVKKRSDTKRGWRIMATICFYQDSRHSQPLNWIRNQFAVGYISKRNDGITELRINGFQTVRQILNRLLPYIKFKKDQVKIMLKAIKLIEERDLDSLKPLHYQKLIEYLLGIQKANYQSSHKKTRQDLEKTFGLTP